MAEKKKELLSEKKKQLPQKSFSEKDFVPTGMGSAQFATVDGLGEESASRPNEAEDGHAPGPPWGVEPSIYNLCDEIGLDYDSFLEAVKENKDDAEIAAELGISSETVFALKDKFYGMEALNGNTGIGGID